jgi:hypothetical protein
MIKIILVLALTGIGVFFWQRVSALPGDMETLAIAAVFWVIALFLLLSFLLESSTRGPWR